MIDSMVWIDKADTRFLLCTRGVAIHRGRVLLFNVVGWDWWALPGGRIEMGEDSCQALVREMGEEIDTNVRVGRLLWIVENFFKSGGKTYHEVGLYYRMTIPITASIFTSEEYSCVDGPVNLRFRWFSIDNLESLNLRPRFLKQALLKIPDHPRHVVWQD